MTGIVLVGDGPVTCSTSLEIDIQPRIIWDVNGYYRELGLDPRSTKRQIKQAYMRKGGWRSERLTYIVKVLVDAEARWRYDMTPLGSLFMDEYILMALHRLRTQAIARLRSEGRAVEADALRREIDAEGLDTEADDEHDHPTPSAAPDAVTPWAYSHYVWHTECWNQDRLRQWQGALIRVLGGRRVHHQIAVGASAYGSEFRTVGYRSVFFLGDGEQPTDALAERVVSPFLETESR